MNALGKTTRTTRIAVLIVATVVALIAPAGVASAEVYGEVSLWGGGIWGQERRAYGNVRDADAPLSAARFSLGGLFGKRDGLNVRVGVAADVFRASEWAAALGVEAQVDRRFTSRWRIGLRLSGSSAERDGHAETGDGQVIMAGVRAHIHEAMLGIDGIFVRYGESGNRSSGNGILVGFGLAGRPGKYALGASAATAAVGLIVAMVVVGMAAR